MDDNIVPHLPPGLLQSLLHTAGISGSPTNVELLGTSTAQVWAVTMDNETYVVRYLRDGDAYQARKEQYLSGLLQQYHVPAPTVLATVADEYGMAILSTHLPGVRLDRVLNTFNVHDANAAWRSVGAVLRQAHAVPFSVAGEIVGEVIEPFAGGWGHWVLESVLDDLYWLQMHLGSVPVERSRIEQVVMAATTILEHRPIQLIHNDALPQNILVAHGPDGWYCTGWLDWEYSRAGDPLWDLATLDFPPAGLVSSSFYEGYGSIPPERERRIYELLMATWRTRVELERGALWDWPPQAARIAYLRDVSTHVEQLENIL